MAELVISDLTKKFGDFTAVDDISFSVKDGTITALLGGSGCGKTTTLRMIAGFTNPTGGAILVDGQDIGKILPYKRNIGVFFQNYALFPHMTTFDNIAFGLKTRKVPKPEIRRRVTEMIALVKLQGMEKRFPREMSGGQQQRVALARALVTRPSILLLDEPLSNLDAKLRVEMQEEIKHIQNELKITTIIVTHDQEEAVSLADEIVVMKEGKIHQIGDPKKVFDYPKDLFVADFMGFSNFIHGTLASKAQGGVTVESANRKVRVACADAENFAEGDSVVLTIRPENVSVDKGEANGENVYAGTIRSLIYKGTTTRLEVSGIFESPLFVNLHRDTDLQVGQTVRVTLEPARFRIFQKPNQV
jgi:spermidine/putrescine ABC transporter ATP-binding subunit